MISWLRRPRLPPSVASDGLSLACRRPYRSSSSPSSLGVARGSLVLVMRSRAPLSGCTQGLTSRPHVESSPGPPCCAVPLCDAATLRSVTRRSATLRFNDVARTLQCAPPPTLRSATHAALRHDAPPRCTPLRCASCRHRGCGRDATLRFMPPRYAPPLSAAALHHATLPPAAQAALHATTRRSARCAPVTLSHAAALGHALRRTLRSTACEAASLRHAALRFAATHVLLRHTTTPTKLPSAILSGP